MQLYLNIYVLMATLVFPSEFIDNRGGVAQTIVELVHGLANENYFNIVVLCPSGSEMANTNFPSNVRIVTTKLSEWHISRTSVFKTLKTVLEVYREIKLLLDKDTWIITNHSVTSALISLMPLRNIKEIYINRGGHFSDNGMATRLILRKIKRSKIDYAVGISHRQVDLLVKSGIKHDKTFLIHDGLPMPKVDYKNLTLKPEKLRISIMGYISDLKNQKEGVRLLKMLRDSGVNAILNIYGDSTVDPEYYSQLLGLIKELDVTKYVNIHGFISGESLFSDTDILISFSKSEGFGRTLVEGMLRYKPIMAWRGAGGPIDITKNGRYGYLVDTNLASEYYSLIMKLLNNSLECVKDTQKAYEFAARNFTTKTMVNRYTELFKRLCV